jgi:ribosomal protein S18 acetylase RimI-like enzyme
MLHLRPMRADELPAFLELTGTFFAESLAESWGARVEEVDAKARADAVALLPHGVATDGHELLVAEDEDGDVVAHAWLGRSERDGRAAAFLFDLHVAEGQRGRGHGREVLELVERRARELGYDRIGLNVFPQNRPALALYRSAGYREVALFLGKRLDRG